VAGNITTQPKQGRQIVPKSSLSILICLLYFPIRMLCMSLVGIFKSEWKYATTGIYEGGIRNKIHLYIFNRHICLPWLVRTFIIWLNLCLWTRTWEQGKLTEGEPQYSWPPLFIFYKFLFSFYKLNIIFTSYYLSQASYSLW
jgi:hypothetical protein